MPIRIQVGQFIDTVPVDGIEVYSEKVLFRNEAEIGESIEYEIKCSKEPLEPGMYEYGIAVENSPLGYLILHDRTHDQIGKMSQYMKQTCGKDYEGAEQEVKEKELDTFQEAANESKLTLDDESGYQALSPYPKLSWVSTNVFQRIQLNILPKSLRSRVLSIKETDKRTIIRISNNILYHDPIRNLHGYSAATNMNFAQYIHTSGKSGNFALTPFYSGTFDTLEDARWNGSFDQNPFETLFIAGMKGLKALHTCYDAVHNNAHIGTVVFYAKEDTSSIKGALSMFHCTTNALSTQIDFACMDSRYVHHSVLRNRVGSIRADYYSYALSFAQRYCGLDLPANPQAIDKFLMYDLPLKETSVECPKSLHQTLTIAIKGEMIKDPDELGDVCKTVTKQSILLPFVLSTLFIGLIIIIMFRKRVCNKKQKASN